MSLYLLKPKFQSLLRPLVRRLFDAGATANQVTLAACAVSVALGAGLYLLRPGAAAYALVPLWMLLRMALNAVDGMLAREFGQASRLGALLNEVTDVVADTMLYLPFAALAALDPFWVGAVIVLAGLSEFAGVLGTSIGASRRYDGPMGKSDRAFVFGALGLAAALGVLPSAPAAVMSLVMPVVALLTGLTVLRRLKNALAEVQPSLVKP